MCGRYTLTTPSAFVIQRFLLDAGLSGVPGRHPRYNIAPSQDVLTVVAAPGGHRVARFMRWGLTPAWATDPQPGPINARSETAARKPLFRTALRRRRCLVPSDGFFEWSRTGRLRVPIRFTLRNGEPFAFAGLWERWTAPDGGADLLSCCILTTEPNDLVRPVLDRMPVILRQEHEAVWLDPAMADPAVLERAFAPYPAEAMVAYPVSQRANNPRFDDPECTRPVSEPGLRPG